VYKQTLLVKGLHPSLTNEEFNDLFRAHGALEACRILQDEFGRSRFEGIVRYHDEANCDRAIKALHEQKVKDCLITVRYRTKADKT
jgi:RNA recognition motif-containing protein